MPKDHWAAARTRDRLRKLSKLVSKGPEVWSEATVLWFGKYKDYAVRDVPRDYLAWLARLEKPTSEKIRSLCLWLKARNRTKSCPVSCKRPRRETFKGKLRSEVFPKPTAHEQFETLVLQYRKMKEECLSS